MVSRVRTASTFRFVSLSPFDSGQAFPMHPLDLAITSNASWLPTPSLNITTFLCVGAYQGGASPYPDIDIVLGDNFLRNVYVS